MSDQRKLYAGIDAGGTKTRLAYCLAEALSPVYAEGPGVNVKRDGVEKTVAVCAQLIRDGCKTNLLDHDLVLPASLARDARATGYTWPSA